MVITGETEEVPVFVEKAKKFKTSVNLQVNNFFKRVKFNNSLNDWKIIWRIIVLQAERRNFELMGQVRTDVVKQEYFCKLKIRITDIETGVYCESEIKTSKDAELAFLKATYLLLNEF